MTTTVSRGKILEALEIIQTVCEQTRHCSDCPLRDWNLNCMLETERPYAWSLVSEEDTAWRAFDD